MQIHCLGTAGYHPSETRHTSCYLQPESGIVLDAGTGLFRMTSRIQTQSLDFLLSHAHLDHVFGLTFLLGILHERRVADLPVQRVRIWGQQDKLDAIQTHMLHDLMFPAPLPVTWHAIDEIDSFEVRSIGLDGRESDDRAIVSWRNQVHPGGSVAYRIDFLSQQGDRRLVYATDTTGAESSLDFEWMSDADLLMHECNFHSGQQEWAETTGHCWLTRVAEICRSTKPRRTLLTHLNPTDELQPDELVGHFDMPTTIATDNAVVDF